MAFSATCPMKSKKDANKYRTQKKLPPGVDEKERSDPSLLSFFRSIDKEKKPKRRGLSAALTTSSANASAFKWILASSILSEIAIEFFHCKTLLSKQQGRFS